ncbi:MAG: DNA translocase FtsK 4TM domain-containing protein, partial [Thermoleophilia bacterium]
MGLGLVALAIFLGVTLFLGFGIGPVGGWLEDGLRLLVGRAVALAPLALIAVGIALILDHPLAYSPPLRLGAALGAAALLIALAGGVFGLGGIERDAWFSNDVVSERGGYLGELGYWATSSTVGDIGTGIVVAAGLIAAVILISGASLGHLVRRGGQGAAVASRTVSKGVATATVTAIRSSQSLRERLDAIGPPTLSGRRRPPPAPRPLLDGADTFPDIFSDPSALPPSPALGPAGGGGPLEDDPGAAAGPAVPAAPGPEDGEEEVAPVFTPQPPSRGRDGSYRAPRATLLRRSSGPTAQPEELVARTSRILQETLGHFGIEATVSDTVSGPRVTRYELQLAPGTKVGRITALRDDLAYALAAREELRIIAPIPGKQAVGVEVPNPEASLVTLGDITREFPSHAGPLMAWLGLDLGGKPVYIDLSRMPHLLIAGSTGTGKSVCLNSLLASILLRATPNELRMILIDPKKVELNHYESIPHLLTPVVTNMKDAAAVLSNIVREMESRYELMGMARARNLRDWNEARAAGGEPPMPTILVVIDELADLMMVSPAEVEDAIIRLAQKSRAVGIHLVLATQRPSADVITGMIKANVPSRIAFAVSSQVDSRVVLDAGGAETLLGHGDMLFRPVGTSRLQRLQGAYVGEEEIRAITDHWRAQGRPELREELMERPEPAEDPVDAEADEMVERAIELVVQQGTA